MLSTNVGSKQKRVYTCIELSATTQKCKCNAKERKNNRIIFTIVKLCCLLKLNTIVLQQIWKQEMKPTAVHILWEQGMHSSHTDISKYSIFNFGHIGLILEADNNLFISDLNGT